MRSRRLLSLTCAAAAAALAACGGPAVSPSGTGPDLVFADRIADAEITTDTRGGWEYRRAAAAGRVEESSRGWAPGDAAPAATAAPERRARAAGGAAPAAPAPPAASPRPSGGRDAVSKGEARDLGGAPAEGDRAARRHLAPQEGQPLHAGSTDDNADLPGFLAFVAQWSGRRDVSEHFQKIDVSGRTFVRVVDSGGRPVPAARVTVVDEATDRLVADATTYGDGRVPVYPRLAGADASGRELLIDVRTGAASARVRARLDGQTDVVVALHSAVAAPDAVPIDVAFVIDTTGSMGDEIASIQECLLRVTSRIRGIAQESDLRAGAVLYRDVGDEYLTAKHPLTSDVGALDAALRQVRASGGGDGPESLNQGLAETVAGLDWRPGAAKVAFLIADAPPHMDYANDTPYGETLRAAVGRGLRIHTVAASGIDAAGTLVFRQVAQFTRGKFIFLQYGAPASGEDAARHGVAGAVKNDNLEDILFEQIRDEVARWGR